MAKYIIHKTKNYTIMSNYHLMDDELTLKAKGLLSLMLSLPENWDYSVRVLEKICKETMNTINSVLNELEEHNYLKRQRIYKTIMLVILTVFLTYIITTIYIAN